MLILSVIVMEKHFLSICRDQVCLDKQENLLEMSPTEFFGWQVAKQ
jgi:hypothetical protein